MQSYSKKLLRKKIDNILKRLKRIDFLLLAIVSFALILRIWRISEQPITMDEGRIISFASNFVSHGGNGLVANWFHPVFRGPLIYLSALIFGNTPFGWRILGVFAGTASVILIWLISKQIFQRKEIAVLSSLFLAVDPLCLGWSRLALEETFASFFMLLSIYFVLKYSREGRFHQLTLSSVSLSLALSIKWYFALLIPLFIIFSLKKQKNKQAIILFLFTPAIIYLITYLPYFLNGNDLKDWVTLQQNMFITNMSLTREDYGDIVGQPARASQWFIIPTYVKFYLFQHRTSFRSLMWLNNPFVWFLTLPAIFYLLFWGWKNKDCNKLFLFSVFLLIYLPLALTSRPIFLYSAIPLLPIAFAAVSNFFTELHLKYPSIKRGVFFYIAAAIIFSLYLYPTTIFLRVSTSLYKPILSLFGISLIH